MPLYNKAVSPLPVTQGGTGLTSAGTAGQLLTSNGSASVWLGDVRLQEEPAGTLARTIPRGQVNAGGLAALNTTGQVAVRGIGLVAGTVVSTIQILTSTTAANTPTHWWFALLDSTLTVKAVSTDQTSTAMAASTAFPLAMGTPYTTASTGLYYVAVSFTGTTAPTLMGISEPNGVVASAFSPILYGSAGTQSAPPSVSAQVNSGTITASGSMNFAAWIS